MINFYVTNSFTKIENFDTRSESLINTFCILSFSQYRRSFYKGGKPTFSTIKKKFFKYHKFPTGWLFDIKKLLESNGFSINIFDNRNRLKNRPLLSLPNWIEKRFYQEDLIKIIQEKHRGIIRHPTRSGKTILAAKVINSIAQPTLILVPNITLLKQTFKVIEDIFGASEVGIIGGNKFDPKRITIASPQKLWASFKTKKTKDFLNSVGLLFIDECHHVSNASKLQWYSISQACNNAYYRYGLTGTLSSDSAFKVLKGVTGKVIHNVEEEVLVKHGYLISPTLKMYKINHFRSDKHIKAVYPNYEIAFEEGILDNYQRNKLIVELALKEAELNRTTLILVTRVKKHGQVLADMLGNSAIFIHGSTKSIERTKALKQFSQKKFLILIGTVFGEGVDIPNLDTVIYTYGGKDPKKVLQGVNRILTPHKNKQPKIIDFFDEDGGVLSNQSKSRLALYKRKKIYNIEVIDVK